MTIFSQNSTRNNNFNEVNDRQISAWSAPRGRMINGIERASWKVHKNEEKKSGSLTDYEKNIEGEAIDRLLRVSQGSLSSSSNQCQ